MISLVIDFSFENRKVHHARFSLDGIDLAIWGLTIMVYRGSFMLDYSKLERSWKKARADYQRKLLELGKQISEEEYEVKG